MQQAVDVPDLFAGLARAVVNAVCADACLVSLVDRSRQTLRDVSASVKPPATLNTVANEYNLSDFPATKRIVETGGSLELAVSDPTADEAERRFLQKLGFGRVLMSALIVEGQVIGIIEAYRLSERPYRFDDDQQIGVLAAFAGSAYSRIQLAAKLDVHYTETIEALMSALEARDPYTQEHTSRIRDVAVGLAVAMHLQPEEKRAVKLGAILHDVGKIGIPDAILRKPEKLTDEEWVVMRAHPTIGEHMLHGVDFMTPALPIIRHHHERWDGKGYPDGLEGDQIPIGARIVAVCDSFDAITSDRPYRKARTSDEACDEILRCAGSQFDPMCAALLVDMVKELGDEPLEERLIHFSS